MLDWKNELELALPDLLELSDHYTNILNNSGLPITAMPRCAVGLATIPVVAKYIPDLCLVWFDAHADLNTPDTSITGYLGGMVIAGAAGLWESGLGAGFNLDNLILVGTRDWNRAEITTAQKYTIKVIDHNEAGSASLLEAIAGRPVYIHIDCDVLDAGIIPSEFQVPQGMNLHRLQSFAESLATCGVIGIEIAEFENVWADKAEPASPAKLLQALKPLLLKLI